MLGGRMKQWFILPILLFSMAEASAIRIHGKLTDGLSGESLIGASIYNPNSKTGTITDLHGHFNLEVDSLPVTIEFSYLGYTTKIIRIQSNTAPLNISLSESATTLNEAKVQAQRHWVDSRNPSASTVQLQGKGWQSLPNFAGEADVIGVLIAMPGVKKGGDGSGGMLVRGGSADQNTVLLNGVPVFQSGHIISFYSPFQPELIDRATLYKGNAPAGYGGRLSSVLDIETLKPDSILRTDLSLGVLLAKAYVRGPIGRNTRFSLAARRSGPDIIWPLFDQRFPAKFYDAQAGLYHDLGKRGDLSWHYFTTSDELSAGGDDISRYKDTEKGLIQDMSIQSASKEQHSSLRYAYEGRHWRFEQIAYALENRNRSAMSWTGSDLGIQSSLASFGVSGQAARRFNNRFNLELGYQLAWYHLNLMEVNSQGDLKQVFNQREAESHRYQEQSVYAQSTFSINSRTSLNGGLRLAYYGQQAQLEPRLELNHRLDETWIVSGGIARHAQGIRRVSSSSTVLPTDIWYPANGQVKVQQAWQTQLSTRKRWNRFVVEGELYYKQMHGLSEYREGNVVFQSTHLSDEVLTGKGWAYGLDLQARYEGKKIQAWVNYSWAKSMRQFDELNEGNPFFDRWDRRHDMNIGAQMKLNRAWHINATFYYASGARYTPRVAQFLTPGLPGPTPITLPVYGQRNSQSLSDAHRLDISATYTIQKARSTWELQVGAYNAYNSLQSFRTEMIEKNGKLVFREVGLFGMMPSLTIKCTF